MSMAKNLKRGKPKKSAGDVLFVAVEGKTEEDYISALRRKYRIPGQRLMIHNVGNGPASEVGRFIKGLSGNKRYQGVYSSIDYRWGVADTEWEHGWKDCAARSDKIPSRGSSKTLWALSSASFERWLLLHYVPSPPKVNAKRLAAELSKYLPGYSSQHKGLTDQQASELMERLPVALKHAKRIRESGCDNDDAFTDVDLLVRQIVAMNSGALLQ